MDYHKLGIARCPEDGMVGTLEVNDFKGECLLVVVHLVIECNREDDGA
jgi:hypothetical protein